MANNIIVKNIAGNPHANDGAHIRVYGYATNFQSDPNCPISTFAPFVMDIPRYWVNPSSFTTKVFYKHPMTPGQNYGTILTAGSVHAPTIFTSDMAIENTTTNEYAIVGWNSTNNAPLSLLDNGNNAPCFDINGIGIVHNSTNPISTNFSWHSYVSSLQTIITPNPANMSYILHDCTTSPLCLPPPAMRLVNVAAKENLFEFNVYPNPSNGEFNVNVSEDLSSDSEIIVRDILGKEIYKTMLTNKTIINLKDSPKGVYQITISNNGKTQTKKIILQ